MPNKPPYWSDDEWGAFVALRRSQRIVLFLVGFLIVNLVASMIWGH